MLKINPITAKRLQRFKRNKRAYYSFWILATLYLLSLLAPLICNDQPLYVRYDGKSYFPTFAYYPDDTFTGSGRGTRPNYKAIRSSKAFRKNENNTMIFPIVAYGPNESIEPHSIQPENTLSVSFAPIVRTCSLSLRKDLSIAKAVGGDFFFQTTDRQIKGFFLHEYWQLPNSLHQAFETRFENQDAEEIRTTCQNKTNPRFSIDILCIPYKSRARTPKTIRVTLIERLVSENDDDSPETLVFTQSLTLEKKTDFWQSLGSDIRKKIRDRVAEGFEKPIDPQVLSIHGRAYKTRFEKDEVRFPYEPLQGHWFGIDNAGRDVLVRILYGMRISLTFGLILVLVSMLIGVIFGALQGYYGGWLDISAQRMIEIWSAIPFLYVMILLGATYGRGFVLLLFCYAIFNWIGISYYLRAEFLRLRKQPFVEAAKCLGLPDRKIIFKHILPNSLVPIITFAPFSLVSAIGALAALDYLGFGMPPPTPSWGELLDQAQQHPQSWWLIFYPALALFIVILLGVFIGEGVRDAYDPKSHSRLVA